MRQDGEEVKRRVGMSPEDQKRLQACVKEMSEILYRNTKAEELTDLESIEKTVRQQLQEHVSPQVGIFLSKLGPKPVKGSGES